MFVGETVKKPKKLLEEIGVETDEEVDINDKEWEELLPKKRRIMRGTKRRFGR